MTNSMPRTLCEAFQQTRTVRPEQIAIRSSDGRLSLSWAEYGRRVEAAARGLYALGVRSGEPIAFLLSNRPEFHIVDTAAVHLGAVPFSMYATLAPEQIAHQLSDSGARVVICEGQFAAKLRAATVGGSVQYFVCVDAELDGMFTLAQLETFETSGFDFESAWRAVQPHDTLTLVYTSGTTGPPKAVELSHANLLAELHGMAQIMPLGFDDSLISYLSDAHMGNRWGVHYTSMRYGIETITLADAKQLVATLAAVHPTYFGAVPYIWYKIKAAVQAAIAAQPDEDLRAAALRAIEIGTAVAWLRNAGEAIPDELSAAHARADQQVLAPLRSRLGLDRARFTTSGAAALAPDAVAFLNGLGLNVCEMWGMTEAAAAVTANPPDAVRFGTVGKIVPDCGEIRIADDGELLVRGPLVMKGYRNNAEKTAETIDPDGWLHTGDIGSIDADGYVRILDRKKELIINSGGKNMSPSNIEGAVKAACPLIGSVVAIGEAKPYVTALVTLDPDAAAAYAARTGLTDATPGALADDPGLNEVIAAGIEAANAKLARVEQIKKFQILPVVWEAGGDELTPTLKLRRNIISAKYVSEIERLYAK